VHPGKAMLERCFRILPYRWASGQHVIQIVGENYRLNSSIDKTLDETVGRVVRSTHSSAVNFKGLTKLIHSPQFNLYHILPYSGKEKITVLPVVYESKKA
jgi:hypothetical protein